MQELCNFIYFLLKFNDMQKIQSLSGHFSVNHPNDWIFQSTTSLVMFQKLRNPINDYWKIVYIDLVTTLIWCLHWFSDYIDFVTTLIWLLHWFFLIQFCLKFSFVKIEWLLKIKIRCFGDQLLRELSKMPNVPLVVRILTFINNNIKTT
jgi:hypothetical protein